MSQDPAGKEEEKEPAPSGPALLRSAAVRRPTYSVLLRSGLPPMELELLELFCRRITARSGGEYLLEFLCTRVDVSHHSYIEMETIHPTDQAISVVRIPHQLVFLIHGSDDRPSIGFVQPSTLPEKGFHGS